MKRRKTLFIVIFLLIFSVLAFPREVKGEEGELNITNWSVDAIVNEDGSMNVKEQITFKFKNKFNGVFRDINLKGSSGIYDISIYDSKSSTPYKSVKEGKKGDSFVYEEKNTGGYLDLKIFSPSKDEEKTFIINYKLANIITNYNDTAELYYKFVGEENKTPIKNFNGTIRIHNLQNSDKVKTYFHGNNQSSIKLEEDYTIKITSKEVSPNSIVAGRVLFPKEFTIHAQKIVKEDAFNKIVDEENALEEKALKKEKNKQNRKLCSNIIGAIITIIITIIAIITFNKFKRVKIKREEGSMLPEDCTPAVSSIIMGNAVATKDIVATLMDLCRKEYIKIEKLEEKIGEKKDKYNYLIIKAKEWDNCLLEHEKYYLNWIFNKIGKGEAVTLEKIELYIDKNKLQFQGELKKWEALVKDDATKKGYIDIFAKSYGVKVLIFSIISIAISIALVFMQAYFALVPFIFSIGLLIWAATLMNRKSNKGYLEYNKWNKYKEYLKGIHYKKNYLEYPEKYLVYAISLGVEEKTLKEIEGYFSSKTNYEYNNSYIFPWYYWYSIMILQNNNLFSSSVDSSFDSTDSYSGGGSFGDGGGGAGGF